MENIIVILLSYLIGSLSSAVLVCRLLRLPDPRTAGSGNPGTTNVLRIGGKWAALFTLIGDVLKGALPVLIAHYLGLSAIVLSAVMFAAFLGHLYPIFFRFKGGKGVATGIGGLLALTWPVGLCALLTWLLVALVSRYSSLAALVAAVLVPLYNWYLSDRQYEWVLIAMTILVFYRHRANIMRLLKGTEGKIGKKSRQ